uniref:Transporter n=1 Tax=Trichobilharzia regenti TaxID=157069 RepID=A0AA85KH22_TRIRE|nr:unnamed protein product [Trichobilharzia regenti]
MTQVLQSSVSLVSVRPRNPSISSDFDDENNPHHVYFGHKKPRNSKSSIQSTNGNKKNNNPTEATNENDGDDRAVWSSRLSFLLSSISFAVDLTTVFRFPYLCYIHGGGAFLIAYLAMLIFCAVPVFYMELLAGQYFRQGCVSIWKLAILFKGIGWASVVLIFFASLYYNAFIAWSFFYFFASFIPELPWEKCNHWWNTVNCQEQSRRNISLVNSSLATAAREFFEIRMLGVDKSSGFNDYGSIQWEVCGCMFLVNLLLFLSLFKGVKVLEKVSWITACVPYLAIAILLIRGLTLENAFYGIKTFLNPSFGKLLDWDVWFAASSQAFFSLGVGFGVHLAYGSFNQVDHPAYVDCILTTAMNAIKMFHFIKHLMETWALYSWLYKCI